MLKCSSVGKTAVRGRGCEGLTMVMGCSDGVVEVEEGGGMASAARSALATRRALDMLTSWFSESCAGEYQEARSSVQVATNCSSSSNIHFGTLMNAN